MPTQLQALLPICVFAMMLCIGLDFSLAHWRSLWRTPRPLWLGILAQNLMIPIAGFSIAWLFRSTPEIALGIVLIVAAPGGPVANAIVHLARARIDVSVSLTTLNGLLSLLSVPLIANWGFEWLAHDHVDLHLPVAPTLRHIGGIILLPIGLGVLAQHWPLAQGLRQFSRHLSLGLLCVILCLAFYGNAEQIAANWNSMLPAAVLLCGTMLALSHGFAWIFRVDRDIRLAIATEVSVHNVPLAILFAESLLQRPELAGFIAVYAPVIALMAIGSAITHRRRSFLRRQIFQT